MIDQDKALAALKNHRRLSLLSFNDTHDLCLAALAMAEMLDDIEKVFIKARDGGFSIDPQSLLAYLADNKHLRLQQKETSHDRPQELPALEKIAGQN